MLISLGSPLATRNYRNLNTDSLISFYFSGVFCFALLSTNYTKSLSLFRKESRVLLVLKTLHKSRF